MMIHDAPPEDHDRHVLRVLPELPSIPAARRFVRDVVTSITADRDVRSDLELATSELVTNAIEHGEQAPVDVEVVIGPSHVELLVTCRGCGDHLSAPDTWIVAGPDEIAGRGLGIVRAVSDRVDVHQHADHFTVVARRSLPGAI